MTTTLVHLKDICRPRQWPTLSMSQLTPTGFPVFGANGQIGFYDSYTHKDPVLLVGCRGSCGTLHITPPQAYANGNAMALDNLDQSRVNIKWLFFFFTARGFLDVISGSSQPQITQSNIGKIEIQLPRLPEQERIVRILDDAEALRHLRIEADERTHAVIPALFDELFGSPVDNSRGWPVAPLHKLGNVVTGTTPPSALDGMFGGEIPFVTPGDLERDTKSPARFVTEAGAAQSRTVRAGSTLVCCIGATIGKTDRTWTRSAFNQQINSVEWSDAVDDDYGCMCMRLMKPLIVQHAGLTALPILKKSLFQEIQIPVPPVELQRTFAARVAEIRDAQAMQASSRKQLGELFQSLLHRTFQGEL